MTTASISIDSFIYNLHADTRDQVLQALAWKVGRATGADMTWLAGQLIQSEQRESSGIGNGVAIPHLKSTPLGVSHIALARLSRAVEFGALDSEPADIVCAVFSPQADGVLHLRRLARVTRLFRESFVLEKLRGARSEAEMEDLFRHTAREVLAA